MIENGKWNLMLIFEALIHNCTVVRVTIELRQNSGECWQYKIQQLSYIGWNASAIFSKHIYFLWSWLIYLQVDAFFWYVIRVRTSNGLGYWCIYSCWLWVLLLQCGRVWVCEWHREINIILLMADPFMADKLVHYMRQLESVFAV